MTRFTQDDIKKLGTILSIWAHPDDESYSCAGIMCTAIENGQNVVCITATKGEAGVQDESRWPAAQLADIRADEMTAALKILGINQHYWLGYHDGHLSEVPEYDAVVRLKALIAHYQPNTILTFGPEGMTGHADHATISYWVQQATKEINVMVYHAVQIRSRYIHFKAIDEQFNIFFNIEQPPLIEEHEAAILFELPETCLQKKYEVLKAMPSQTERMFSAVNKDLLDDMLELEAFVRAK
jgi:LmbE family N-acetylglucosaminyl deacetylase